MDLVPTRFRGGAVRRRSGLEEFDGRLGKGSGLRSHGGLAGYLSPNVQFDTRNGRLAHVIGTILLPGQQQGILEKCMESQRDEDGRLSHDPIDVAIESRTLRRRSVCGVEISQIRPRPQRRNIRTQPRRRRRPRRRHAKPIHHQHLRILRDVVVARIRQWRSEGIAAAVGTPGEVEVRRVGGAGRGGRAWRGCGTGNGAAERGDGAGGAVHSQRFEYGQYSVGESGWRRISSVERF
mmetsp:Transcript_8346/g.17176  ORF Transcript_8346/g.17176 Transcript_8346/m.17176 type:complete len:236 (+) Transcript_8346:1014-1721(+)